ncbi:dihydroorotase domain protein [Mycobacterium xenopi 3993]|nr:dihydroorotase domain protein [Mycobacterium xenopi 3993]
MGLAGKELTEMGMMAAGAAQVRMFSDDGNCVADPLVMRRALEYATGLGVLIAQHAEEPRLTVGSVAHEGPTPRGLALPGGRGRPRSRSSPVTRCWPATPAPGCISATPPPPAPSRFSTGLRRKVFRSPPKSPRIT